MNFASLFGFGADPKSTEDLPIMFEFPMQQTSFVKDDVVNIYARILTDALERTEGLSDVEKTLLWDNCLASEAQDGLVSLLSKAMADKAKLFIVYDKSIDLVRKATAQEQVKIEADYKASNESATGVYITFQNYRRTDFVKLYSTLEYFTVASLYKNMNLSKSIQLKISALRSSVGLNDSAEAAAQGIAIAGALAKGRDVMLDGADSIETAKPDLTATNSSMEFIAQKQSFYLGVPSSYISGQGASGISDTGKSDSKAVERGLRGYYFSILKPVLEALFKGKTSFRSDDFEMLDSAAKVLTIFEASTEDLISKENKTSIINKLFGLPEEAKGDDSREVTPTPPKELPPSPTPAPVNGAPQQ